MVKYTSYSNWKENEREKMDFIFQSNLNIYSKLVLLLQIIHTDKNLIDKISDEDFYIINFMRNAIVHGHAFAHYSLIDQMYRFDVINNNFYLDFDLNENTDESIFIHNITSSKLFLNSEHYDGENTLSVYNCINARRLTISIDLEKFLDYISEAFYAN